MTKNCCIQQKIVSTAVGNKFTRHFMELKNYKNSLARTITKYFYIQLIGNELQNSNGANWIGGETSCSLGNKFLSFYANYKNANCILICSLLTFLPFTFVYMTTTYPLPTLQSTFYKYQQYPVRHCKHHLVTRQTWRTALQLKVFLQNISLFSINGVLL